MTGDSLQQPRPPSVEMSSVWASPASRVGFIATVSLAMAVSTFIAFAFGTLAPFLIADFSLTRAELGMLTTLMFLVGGVLSPAAGPQVDTHGGRRLLQILFAATAASFLLVAVAPSYGWVIVASCVGGVGLAINNPVTNKLVGEHVPKRRQGIVMGLKQSGVQFGAFLAGILPAGAVVLGWRATLAVAVVVILGGMAATRLWVPPDSRRDATRQTGPAGALWPAVGWLGGYALLMGFGVAILGAYLPLYAHERLDLDVSSAGLLAAFVGLVGVAGRIAWGRVGDAVTRIAGPLVVIAVVAAVGQMLIWTAELVGPELLWAGALLLGGSSVAWNAVGMLAIVKVLDMRDVGRASGLVLVGFYAGYVAGPVTFGYSVDVTTAYTIGWALVTAGYAAAAVVAGGWYMQQRRAQRRDIPNLPGGPPGMRQQAPLLPREGEEL